MLTQQKQAPVRPAAPDAVPLVVDLDGTLIFSDLLWESLVLFLKKSFLRAWLLPVWVTGGKAAFKERLAAEVELDPAALPYDRALIELIRDEREQGREVVLATGSHARFAGFIADHLDLFDRVLATPT
jgi:hydroxymethylpyrimidine pyrophosphatase-like HAD family hydrolase